MEGPRGGLVRRVLRALALVAVLVGLAGFALGYWSRREGYAAPGSVADPCPGTPNCVSSLATDGAAIAPLTFEDEPSEAWRAFVALVEERATAVLHADERSLHAVFDSRVFGFRDDLLVELDRDGSRLQVRSSSRVGRSDLGANRARVEALRAGLAAR